MKIFILFIAALLSACGTPQDSVTDTDNSIIGTWESTDKITLCKTSITFNSNLTFNGTSLDNISSGTYTVAKPSIIQHTNKLSLYISYLKDNGLSNCAGISEDATGKKIEIPFRIFSNTLYFYDLDYTNTQPLLILKRKTN